MAGLLIEQLRRCWVKKEKDLQLLREGDGYREVLDPLKHYLTTKPRAQRCQRGRCWRGLPNISPFATVTAYLHREETRGRSAARSPTPHSQGETCGGARWGCLKWLSRSPTIVPRTPANSAYQPLGSRVCRDMFLCPSLLCGHSSGPHLA